MTLKQFAKHVFKKLTELRIIESRDIIPVPTDEGVELYFRGDIPEIESSFNYPGSFFIAQKNDTTIQIWDKEESDVYASETEGEGATRAGYFIHGLEYEELEVEKAELTVTKSGAIVARLEYDIETKLYTMSLLIMDVFHPGDNTTFNKKIGYVEFESGKIKKLKQTWFGGDIPVTGRG